MVPPQNDMRRNFHLRRINYRPGRKDAHKGAHGSKDGLQLLGQLFGSSRRLDRADRGDRKAVPIRRRSLVRRVEIADISEEACQRSQIIETPWRERAGGSDGLST